VARGIRARDEIARSKWTSASYCLQLCDLLAPGSIYAEGTLSGTAAPQASVSLRKADCQFRAMMSWAQFIETFRASWGFPVYITPFCAVGLIYSVNDLT
jgi:hypothetical protein